MVRSTALPLEVRLRVGDRVTEKDLQAAVMAEAATNGWRGYHTWTSMHSAGGFPDCVLVRPPRIVFVELKGPRGKVSEQQAAWLDDLAGVPGVEVYVWHTTEDDVRRMREVLT